MTCVFKIIISAHVLPKSYKCTYFPIIILKTQRRLPWCGIYNIEEASLTQTAV